MHGRLWHDTNAVSSPLCRQLAAKLGDGSFIDVVSLRAQIDALMTDKLRLLTPKIVKKVRTEAAGCERWAVGASQDSSPGVVTCSSWKT